MSGFVLPEMLVRSAGMGGVTRWELIHCLLEGALADFFLFRLQVVWIGWFESLEFRRGVSGWISGWSTVFGMGGCAFPLLWWWLLLGGRWEN